MKKTTIGSYEAKTHLPSLLDKVASGESFTITKRGKPIALLTPIREDADSSIHETVQHIRELRKNFHLKDITLKDLINSGRK